MAGSKFDSKSFNPMAFGAYLRRIPNLKRNALINSGVLTGNPQINNVFSSQTTTAYATIPFYGLLDGEPVNYDGQTDITATGTNTYEQGVTVIGRAKAWKEFDFSYDITAGVDFMSNVAQQVAAYWAEIDQKTLLSVLKGLFAMTGDGKEFTEKHTYDISDLADCNVGPSTLNEAIQRAAGDNKNIFTAVIMHSAVATNLENLNLLNYIKQNDADGIQRDLALATWNGRTVIIDDSMPSELNEDVDKNLSDTKYTTYILGRGAFDYADIGAKVPNEMYRDPKTNGGLDVLYTRQRKVFSPFGISYLKTNQVSLSPTDSELEDGANWGLINDGSGKIINHRSIPIARIISKG